MFDPAKFAKHLRMELESEGSSMLLVLFFFFHLAYL